MTGGITDDNSLLRGIAGLKNIWEVAVNIVAATDTAASHAGYPCISATLFNDTGVSLDVDRGNGTTPITIPDGGFKEFIGITDLSDLRVTRNTGTASVNSKWECVRMRQLS